MGGRAAGDLTPHMGGSLRYRIGWFCVYFLNRWCRQYTRFHILSYPLHARIFLFVLSTLQSAHRVDWLHKGIYNQKKQNKTEVANEASDVVKKINEILDAKIRPAVARDGGDITFKSFKDGIVTVELKGSCSGCPSSTATLKQGVQNLLCHYITEVKSVEAV